MSAYSPDDPKPLVGYAVLTAAFNGLVAAYALAPRRSGRELPGKLPAGDFVLLAGGTQKLSRLINKYRVTSFPRSTLTPYKSEGGPRRSERSREALVYGWPSASCSAPLLGLACSPAEGIVTATRAGAGGLRRKRH